MDKRNEQQIEKEIEELIDRYARNYEGRDFIKALDLVIDHAQTAKDAREEELGDDSDDSDDE
jgi:hypothetical protein